MEINNEFKQLGLSDKALHAITKKGFEQPSPIQKITIPVLLSEDNDIIAQAQTGTGKTAAFGLPLIEKLEGQPKGIKALVLVPTRELALQVCDEMLSLAEKRVVITAVYGGQSISEQQRRIKKGVDIVVGTPGRILDLIRRGDLDFSSLQYFVLDEADEMLNMGFIDDIELIMKHTPDEKRVWLFSATMPDRIVKLAKKYMKSPKKLQVDRTQPTTGLTDQIYFEVHEGDKFDALTRIIDIEPEFYGLVFCRTRNDVDTVTNKLIERGYAAEGLHGEISQAQREKTLKKFRKKYINILIATDVAARGIDIADLTHVINYSLPQDPESYIHRIGRTGRAGKQGTAITFVSPTEYRKLNYFQKATKVNIRKELLPAAEDIVAVKREKIKEELREIIQSGKYSDYLGMAEDLIETNSPEVALAALLRLAFKTQLDASSYSEIRTFHVDTKGTTRLFIGLGKKDGMNPRKISEFIRKEVQSPDRKIDDILVRDDFSFITVPFKEAERILNAFANRKTDGKPLITKAKPKKK
ncbi:MAG: ATP-dependent helicase DeaD [Tenuifilum sp.]|uniref:DEAD/DEAH box helicase n=1 Tax=Tenuifilum sp. TaxID=2760880 RepID=UPI0024AB9088|nr:DEAD/DEAH box helicase [Tenuifilum sp.]MDI3526146.1 ATP-dependent helicase DeaD [Tenuifilum sp.]